MICREIMNAFRPKQRQSMWLKYIFYVVSVCRRCTFSFNMTKTQRNQIQIWVFFLSICHVTCIPWINFHKGSIHTVIRWYANFCQKVKRYQNHMQRNARSLQCCSIVKCFRELGNSKIWPNLYAMFFITGSLRVLQRHYMYIVYWHCLFIKRILFYVPKRCWWESYTAKF